MKNTHGRVLVSTLIKAKVSHVFFFFLIVEMVPNHATYLVVTRSIIYGKYYLSLREKCPNTELFLVRIFLISVRIQENTDKNNSVFGHFSRSVLPMLSSFLLFIPCQVPHSQVYVKCASTMYLVFLPLICAKEGLFRSFMGKNVSLSFVSKLIPVVSTYQGHN